MIWPQRIADFRHMPEVHAVVVSHRHPDHFDPACLARFPRDVPIVVPEDPILLATLKELNFTNVIVARSMTAIRIGDIRITPTPAATGVIENGYVVETAGAKVWNMIDTVPAPGDVALVNTTLGPFDVAVVPWQPLIDIAFSQGKEAEFPVYHYGKLIENALQVDANTLALGACGFCAAPEFSFLNDSIFPVAEGRFVADACIAGRRRPATILRPVAGDLIEVGEHTKLHSQVLDYCRSSRLTQGYRWQPWAGHLRGRSTLNLAERASGTARILDKFFRKTLPAFHDDNRAEFRLHRARRCVYEYNVYFRNGHETWFLEFGRNGSEVRRKAPKRWPTTVVAITADALLALLRFSLSWSRVVQASDYTANHLGYQAIDGGIVPMPETDDPMKMFFAGDDHLAVVIRATVRALKDSG